jgi:hypothetical protein
MNKKLMIVMVVLLAGALCLSACGTAAQGNPGVSLPNAIFSDDFSDAGSGWKRAAGEHGSTDYLDGTFHIKVDAAKYDLWSNPGLNLGNVSIEVDATKVAGPETDNFGLICRYQDAGNFYFAQITSSGYYGFGKMMNGIQLLDQSGYVASDLVKTGNATNHLRLTCDGDVLTLYINGSEAGSITDTSFSSGDVGLMAGTFNEGGLDIAFDNFVVADPGK